MQELEKQAARGDRLSVKQAQIDAGYSESYANSGHITRTKEWRNLLEKALPDELLMKVHKDGLKATNTIYASDHGQITDTQLVPDNASRFRFLDSGYKLKGKYEPTEHKIEDRRTLDEVDDEIAETLSEIAEII